MQTTSYTYKRLLASPHHKVRYQVLMYKANGSYDTYGMDYITNLKTSHQLFESGNPNVGNAIGAQIDLGLREFISEPPKLAKMKVQVQLYIPGTATIVTRLGDVDRDGSIDSTDALIAAKISSHSTISSDYIPEAAEINDDGVVTSADAEEILSYSTGQGSQYPIGQTVTRAVEDSSEWLTTGVFFIDTREKDELTGEVTIHGYDAMLKGDQDIYSDGTYYDSWPKTDIETVEFIAENYLGCTVDSRTIELLTRGYSIPFPGYGDDAITARGMLQYIAGINGGNFIMSPVGALRFVQLNHLPMDEDGNLLINEDDDYIVIGGVRILLSDKPTELIGLIVDEESNYITFGNDSYEYRLIAEED